MPDPASHLQTNLPLKQPGLERRVHVRHVRNLAAFCRLIATESDDTWQPGVVHDISIGGVGLASSCPLLPGKLLAVQLEGLSRRLLARVVHARRRVEGGWFAGCELLSQLREEELGALLGG